MQWGEPYPAGLAGLAAPSSPFCFPAFSSASIGRPAFQPAAATYFLTIHRNRENPENPANELVNSSNNHLLIALPSVEPPRSIRSRKQTSRILSKIQQRPFEQATKERPRFRERRMFSRCNARRLAPKIIVRLCPASRWKRSFARKNKVALVDRGPYLARFDQVIAERR